MSQLSQSDREAIRKYFGKELEELDPDSFQALRKQLRARYHPDNFEKFEDETVREMATERFQLIEALSEKIDRHLQGKLPAAAPIDHPGALFAFNKMKIEVITADKDLKYHLFGARYRWLLYGHSFRIPGTQAAIIIDEEHRGASIGYRETIRMYLTFGTEDSTEDIVNWLYERIEGRANSLIIHGETVAVQPHAILQAIRRTSFLRIE